MGCGHGLSTIRSRSSPELDVQVQEAGFDHPASVVFRHRARPLSNVRKSVRPRYTAILRIQHGSNIMPTDLAHEFATYLRDKNHLPGDSGVLNGAAQPPANRALQKLWELTDLSANDFADEVAEFFQVPRITLPELLSAEPLADRFSQRFLREMLVFPSHPADGEPTLAVADPSDFAAAQAARVALWRDGPIHVAPFEATETPLRQPPGN